MTQWNIIGDFGHGPEIVDYFDTKAEAEAMLAEYKLAFNKQDLYLKFWYV